MISKRFVTVFMMRVEVYMSLLVVIQERIKKHKIQNKCQTH